MRCARDPVNNVLTRRAGPGGYGYQLEEVWSYRPPVNNYGYIGMGASNNRVYADRVTTDGATVQVRPAPRFLAHALSNLLSYSTMLLMQALVNT